MAIRQEELGPFEGDAVVYRFPPPARGRPMGFGQRLALGTLGVMVVAGFLLSTGPAGTAPASIPEAPKRITVQPGDTLWGIASRYAPDHMDPRAYVDALEELNDLEGPLQAGLKLRLPR